MTYSGKKEIRGINSTIDSWEVTNKVNRRLDPQMLQSRVLLILFKSADVMPIYTLIGLLYKLLNQMGPNAGRAL